MHASVLAPPFCGSAPLSRSVSLCPALSSFTLYSSVQTAWARARREARLFLSALHKLSLGASIACTAEAQPSNARSSLYISALMARSAGSVAGNGVP
eukprot:6173349-Pleurochrysis_carterae.AAC.9